VTMEEKSDSLSVYCTGSDSCVLDSRPHRLKMVVENKSVMFGLVNIITHFDAFPKLFDTCSSIQQQRDIV